LSGEGLLLDPRHNPEQILPVRPAIDATAIIADLVTFALDRFDQVKILCAVDFAEDDVAGL
jgi:hypothetical protein